MRSHRTRIRRNDERAWVLRSFWMTAFDGDEHLAGVPVTGDTIDVAAYERRVAADYRTALDAGIACVRETIDWRRTERAHRFDFETVRIRAACAQRIGIQIVWTLCHSSWPRDIDIGSAQLIERFARFAQAAARSIAETADARAPVYAPVNEISFLAWALAETELFGPQPAAVRHHAPELARQWVRAALAACDAVLEVEPRARFLHAEPAMPLTDADESRLAVRSDIFDMLAGRLDAPLGGHPRYLDLVGVHYHHGPGSWRGTSDRGRPPFIDGVRGALHRLLADVYDRHGRPIIVAETSAASSARAAWLRELGAGIGEALQDDIPVIGACLCRATERPAWEDPRCWQERRLWDALLAGDAPRAADTAYARALRDVQARIGALLAVSRRRHSR